MVEPSDFQLINPAIRDKEGAKRVGGLCVKNGFVGGNRYADKRTEISDSMDTLLIYEGGEIVKRKPIRKVSA